MRRGAALAGAVALVVGSAGAGWWAATRAESADQAVASAEPPEPAVLTEPVERRPLVATIALRGVVVPSQVVRVPLAAPAGSLPVVTARPVPDGGEVGAGAVAVEVAGRPVVVLPGAVPAYRDLHEGASGPDVAQLEAALAGLGIRPGRRDGAFDAATSQAVATLWRRAGYEPGTAAGTDPATGAPTMTAVVPRTELVFVPSAPMVVSGVNTAAGEGEGTADAAPTLVLATADLVVHGTLPAAHAGRVGPGTALEIVSDVSGARHPAEVVDVGPPTADTGEHPVVVRPAAPLPRSMEGENVRLVVELGRTEGAPLVVPVAAVSARADGDQEIVVLEDGKRRRVRVAVELVADGYVALRPVGGDLSEGDAVVTSG